MKIEEFQKIIKYKFKDKNKLINALTHPSFAKSEFELYEFLGDRILSLSIADYLFRTENNLKTMAVKHSNLVKAEMLNQIAEKWHIKKYLQHSINADLSKKILCDVTEAVIAAVYLDSDYKTANSFVLTHWKVFLQENHNEIDIKAKLQEFLQMKKMPLPIYEIISQTGKEHMPLCQVKLEIKDYGFTTAFGKSKSEASKQAAILMMEKLLQ